MLFQDREDAGRQLAGRLAFLKDEKNLIVLGIPRGGVVVAAQIALALHAHLDVFIAHKIGAPFNSELAIGALTSTGEVFLDENVIARVGLAQHDIEREIEIQRLEIARRLERYRGSSDVPDLKDRQVIVVDDGVATGSTMLVSLRALRKQAPEQLLLAIPVGPAEVVDVLSREGDGVLSLETPEPFLAVGRFYRHFEQVEDEQVIDLLNSVHGIESGM
jgi:putative phosphoribosyl transferase